MDSFNLPQSTVVQRVVPKNSFDSFTSSKQKELFTKYVAKITWSNSLSSKTINLSGKEILEIQIFHIELKEQQDIKAVLNIIDKVIPYHIIFEVSYGNSVYLSTSSKHQLPPNEDKSVIDWTFKTSWFKTDKNSYKLDLKKSLDYIFYEFCAQLSLKPNKSIKNISDLVSYNARINAICKEIAQLKKKIASCEQFNKKVELNLKLKKLEQEFNGL